MSGSLAQLRSEILSCGICAEHLAAGPRPIVQFDANARILVIGQAPGAKVHASGVPWQDDSGDRLRDWMGISETIFYDPARIALMPMGFCYPGKGASGDLPPRPECAPHWHDRVLSALPNVRLTLLVGTYAQERYLTDARHVSMTERVRGFETWRERFWPLPHPSWRSTGWMRKNPWFTTDLLPALRGEIAVILRN